MMKAVEEKASRKRKIIRDAAVIASSVVVAIIIHQLNSVELFLTSQGESFFILSAIFVGILFASTFTVSIACSIFLILAQSHSPLPIALLGGFGAFLGDSLIFKFLRDDLIADFEYLERHFGKDIAKRIFHSKLIFWFAPIVAAIVIASPIPDEIGLLMLAGIKLKYHQFIIISYVLNTVGIFFLITIGSTLF